MTTHTICDACECVSHCSKNGCIPFSTEAPIFRDSPCSGLIAAAPDLLAACKVAFDQTCSVGRPKDWEQLRAAIAKATGAAA